MSAVAAPPAWVLALDLDSGSWRCLVGLWSYADFGTTGDTHVWPRREQLAERTGQSENALKKQLRKLAELGYIEAEARGWRLVWRAERGPQGPARILQAPKHAGPTGSGPDTTGTLPDTTGPEMGPTGSGPINQAGPHKTQQDPAEETPAREARHLAIVEQQARLAAERAETRAGLEADPRRLVTREVVDVVRAAGAVWAQQLERDRWRQALGESIRELELTTAQVAEVIAAWDRACAAAGGPLAVEAAGRGARALPTRAALWYASSRRWVASQLRPAGALGEAGSSRTATPIGCSAVAEVPLLGGRSW